MTQDLQFLKNVLSVPTKTYKEDLMVQFIVDWLKEQNISYVVDEYFNVYATKQSEDTPDAFIFPCVIAHTDTVHNITSINIKEENLLDADKNIKLALKAYDDNGFPTGIGGDDKCGVFACLSLLLKMPNLKAAFFVSEETGCHGSKMADKSFFANVGYAIQFDAPENWMVTETCFGVRLFDRNSEFFNKCDEILTKYMSPKKRYMSHPYTDVWQLKLKFNFACINLSIGYYQYHTPNEYVVVDDVFSGIEIGEKLIETLGYEKHYVKRRRVNQYSFWG